MVNQKWSKEKERAKAKDRSFQISCNIYQLVNIIADSILRERYFNPAGMEGLSQSSWGL